MTSARPLNNLELASVRKAVQEYSDNLRKRVSSSHTPTDFLFSEAVMVFQEKMSEKALAENTFAQQRFQFERVQKDLASYITLFGSAQKQIQALETDNKRLRGLLMTPYSKSDDV